MTTSGTCMSVLALAASLVAPGCLEPIQQADIPDSYPKPAKCYDLNSVTRDELETLTGIGPVLAGRIIEFREKFGFERVEDLLAVEGIGEKKFLQIRSNLYVKSK